MRLRAVSRTFALRPAAPAANERTAPFGPAVPFLPANVTQTPVGTLTLTFANGNRATFAYTVTLSGGAVTQSKTIERTVFAPPGTVCR